MSPDRFARIFDVLELLVAHPEGLTVTEVSKRLRLPVSSTHNLLHRLVETEAVVATDKLRYSIGSRAVRLGIRVVGGLEVPAVARRHLQELAREIGEDLYLAVRLGWRIAYVDRLPGTRIVSVDIRLGQSLYLHATSVGKLFAAYHPDLRDRLFEEPRPKLTPHTLTEPDELTAELDQIVAAGHSVSREEGIAGIVGLAVPIMDAHDTLVAAIHISTLRALTTDDYQNTLLSAATKTAVDIERDLGRTPADGPGASPGATR